MNSGYNPALSIPSSTAKKQMATNTIPFYQGGSQIQSALGYTPIIPKIATKPIQIKR
jgi:hypothetical protein